MDSSIGQLSGSALEKILRKYFTEHSSRRLNFLYWNLTDAKDLTLNFINITGKELNRINNSDLVYRIVKLKNQEDWNTISYLINTYLIDPADTKAIYVIRVDYLLSYLKTINFDMSKINLTRGDFGVAYCNNDDNTKRKPLCVIDADIQSLFLIDRLYLKYRKMLHGEVSDAVIKDITDEYLNDLAFKYRIEDPKILLPTTDALDVVSRKFIVGYKNKEASCKLEQIYIKNGLSTIVNRFIGSDITVLTVRVYIQIFLKQYSKRAKQNG